MSNVQVPVYFSGSPLARSWGFFDARPLDWSFGTAGWCLPENSAFSNITNALSKTVKRVCNLKHEDGVSPVVFNNQSLDTEPVLRPGMDAFARLKEVKLTISYGYSDANEYKNLRGLRHLLRCVRGLEMLGLGFSRHGSGCGDEWFTYESVFPKDGTWPHLRKFVVQNLKITDEELVHLLFARMFSLQHLEIGDMHLLHGTWERVIETLRFRGLISFEMSSYQLLYDDKECFLAPLIYQEVDDEGRACRDFIASIERYVVYGRHDFTLRHPSLKADQPTQDSLEFLELDDVFGRFQVVRGTADNVLIDTALLKTKIAEVCAEANRNREGTVSGSSDINCNS